MDGDDPYIDPETRPILEQIRERMRSRPPAGEIPVADMRVHAAEDLAHWNEGGPSLTRVEEGAVEGPAGGVPVRLYYPGDPATPAPTLIYCHGGGWVIGSLDTEDYSLRLLARESGCNIVSVDYRLAPEHRFPAAVEDCLAVARHFEAQGAESGVDSARLALGGASAGANVALAAALALRDAGERWLRFCLLLYGAFSPGRDSASHRSYGGGDFFLTSDAMDYFWSCYLGDEVRRPDPLAAPLTARLEGLPPVHLVAAGLDPLRDDTRLLAQRLRDAGVGVREIEYPGVLHGFTLMARELAVARRALREAGEALRTALVADT